MVSGNTEAAMPLSSRVALALALAVFTAWPAALHAQGPALKYAEDKFNVCKSDSAYNRCLEGKRRNRA